MNMMELMLILVNVLLIVIIIAVYVRISMTIKQQGFQISVLLKHDKEAYKEAMSPAMRIMRAKQMKNATNYLLPADKRAEYAVAEDDGFSVPYRGSDIDHLLVKKEQKKEEVAQAPVTPVAVPEIPTEVVDPSSEEAAKAGLQQLNQVSFDTSKDVPMTNELPVEVQTGVAPNVNMETFSVNGRANAGLIFGGEKFTAPNKFKPRV
jgi:hypothetical protein